MRNINGKLVNITLLRCLEFLGFLFIIWIISIDLFTYICIIIQGDAFYLFYETKNSITMQGDIGVSKSTDKGATWQQLGVALDEDWHLSYPYVFEHDGQVLFLRIIFCMFCCEYDFAHELYFLN